MLWNRVQRFTPMNMLGIRTSAHDISMERSSIASGIESVWAVLKRGYNGVYHQWSAKHMARYVNEFTFRLNEGTVKRHTLDRLESLVKGAVENRLTYQVLIAD